MAETQAHIKIDLHSCVHYIKIWSAFQKNLKRTIIDPTPADQSGQYREILTVCDDWMDH